MKLSLLLTIGAVVALVFGLGDVFATKMLLAQYGVENPDPNLINSSRLLGVCLLGIAVLSWMMRDAKLSYGRRAGLASLFVVNLGIAIVMLVALLSQEADGGTAMRWVTVALGAAFAAGYGYYLNQEHSQVKERSLAEKVKA